MSTQGRQYIYRILENARVMTAAVRLQKKHHIVRTLKMDLIA